MGLYAFDMKGIIYGPLLVCLFFMIFEILKSLEDKNMGSSFLGFTSSQNRSEKRQV